MTPPARPGLACHLEHRCRGKVAGTARPGSPGARGRGVARRGRRVAPPSAHDYHFRGHDEPEPSGSWDEIRAPQKPLVGMKTSAPEPESQRAAELSAQALFAGDRASKNLGIGIEEVGPGFARLRMMVREDMVNGHGMCHGGIVFALADSAFAVACNTHNAVTVAAAASIDFLASAHVNDELTAEARELWRSKRSGIYEISVSNQRGETLALFRGRSHCIGGQLVSIADAGLPPSGRR